MPAVRVPQSWELSFATQPGAGPVFLGLFRTCRGGRDWAVASAPRAEWSFDCTAPRSQQALAAQLAAAKHCLTVRGGRPTAVMLRCDASDATEAALWALAVELGGAGQYVTELIINQTDDDPSHAVAGFLRCAVPRLFPNLTTLTLTDCAFLLPASAGLPRLRSVTAACGWAADAAVQTLLSSLAPYLPQLHSLTMSAHRAIAWASLFTPSSTSQTLQRFSTRLPLTDQLLSLLLAHTPNLSELSFGRFDVNIADHRHQQWKVETLYHTEDLHEDITGERTFLEPLMRLPTSAVGGRVAVKSRDTVLSLCVGEEVSFGCSSV